MKFYNFCSTISRKNLNFFILLLFLNRCLLSSFTIFSPKAAANSTIRFDEKNEKMTMNSREFHLVSNKFSTLFAINHQMKFNNSSFTDYIHYKFEFPANFELAGYKPDATRLSKQKQTLRKRFETFRIFLDFSEKSTCQQ